ADLGVHLDLADALVVILNRVFHRDDLDRFALDFVEAAVEGRGLAGAGRAGDENNAVRQVDQLAEQLIRIRQHADVGEVEDHAALIQKTHDDAFAMDHRDNGDVDVDFSVVDAHLYAAVPWQVLLRNVRLRHVLDAADDRRLESVVLRWQG